MFGDTAAWLAMSEPDRPTCDRVKAIFHYNQVFPDPHSPDRYPPPFHSKGRYNQRGHLMSDPAEKTERLRSFCTGLFNLVDESPSHIAPLDRRFSELLECNFHPSAKSSAFHDDPYPDTSIEITKRTLKLLERLPATPIELPNMPSGLPPTYFVGYWMLTTSDVLTWDKLRIASYLSTNVIRVAMCMIIEPWIGRGKIREFADDIASLLDVATQSSLASRKSAANHRWFVVRSFLWVSWHRTVMLYFALLLGQHLDAGVDDSTIHSLVFLQSFAPVPGVSIQEMSKRYAAVGKSHYMCTWAFQLLRDNPVCISSDFRKFHRLYSDRFDKCPTRCSPDGTLSCKGDHPYSCRRFAGMVVRNQSAHDHGCKGCKAITWDEMSFRSTPGARAVSLNETGEETLACRTASNQTLAVSHVWSHGQGGRPETGMNICLHERYKTIARSMGCDSYWMDTPCIPTDHVLRREAILYINQVFSQSKVTLVCDRDLMQIDINDMSSVETYELILITAMTCDWNVRAWTLLESFRARRSIHLLCRDNKIISLQRIVEVVHREGSLDIGLLLLTVSHLLPGTQRWAPPNVELSLELQGFLTVENGAMYLSHRPASRPGDDIVIWSLLLHDTVYENAIDFWRSRHEEIIHTSFLVSTAPRLKIWRLGWAPASPCIFFGSTAAFKPRSMGINDTSSEVGRITDEGLKADWLFCKLGRRLLNVSKIPMGRRALKTTNIQILRKRFLDNYRWGALLRPVKGNEVEDNLPAANMEDASQVLIVVCGSNNDPHDNDQVWEWRGVHEWDLREPLPAFKTKKDILLV